ncbi:hypothetical protein KAI92_03290 [Candidatus Parcubacteria bacterium]|nr:hypothetical protein [Candidatus Parcubacteria bacterium]
MDVQDLLKNAMQMTDYEFEKKLNKLVRDNYKYRNLDSKNRELVMDLFKKYKKNFRRGIGMSYTQEMNEYNKLKRDRTKLGITLEDVKDIREILDGFRK